MSAGSIAIDSFASIVNPELILMLTSKPKLWKLLKKVQKNWFHELKRANIATKTNVTKVRAKPQIIGTADVNPSAMLPR